MSRTKDAYSRDRYYSWRQCIVVLIERGYSDVECEAILKSKILRWASDRRNQPHGRASSMDLLRYMDRFVSASEIKDLVECHLADLEISETEN